MRAENDSLLERVADPDGAFHWIATRTNRACGRLGAIALVVALGMPAIAHAQANAANDATRRDLIQQAQGAAEHGDHARALDLAMRAGEIRMSPPLRRMIAEEQEATQHFAEALASAQTCVQENQADPSIPGRRGHITACNAIVQRMQAHVGHVVLQTPSSPPAQLHVTVAGADVPNAAWGVPYAVNSGTVHVEASAPGFDPLQTDVQVDAGGTVNVPVELHATPASSPPPVVASASPSPAPPPVETSSGPPWTPIFVGAGILAVAGIATGVITNVLYLSSANRFNSNNCFVQNGVVMGGADTSMCQSDFNSGRTMETVSLAGYIAGGVLAVVAIGAFVLSRGSHHEAAHATRTVLCAPSIDRVGAGCVVTF